MSIIDFSPARRVRVEKLTAAKSVEKFDALNETHHGLQYSPPPGLYPDSA
jgi:hypothetical protein